MKFTLLTKVQPQTPPGGDEASFVFASSVGVLPPDASWVSLPGLLFKQ